MKISLNKLILIIVVAVIVMAIAIGIIVKTNSNSSKKGTEKDKVSIGSKLENTKKYDGKEERGTKEKFEIKLDESILPEDIEKDSTQCIVNGITWYYYLDSKGNANYLSTYSTLQGNVVIPSELDGHKVLSIGKRPSANYLNNTLFKR